MFSSTTALSTAVERLGLAGFDRASLYVLGLESAPGESAAALADDKMAQRSPFSQMRKLFCKIPTDSVTEIFRYMVRATDGDAGFLKKIVFDGDNWRVNTMVVELRGLPLFDSAQLNDAPHHARYDAMALRDYVSAHGL